MSSFLEAKRLIEAEWNKLGEERQKLLDERDRINDQIGALDERAIAIQDVLRQMDRLPNE